MRKSFIKRFSPTWLAAPHVWVEHRTEPRAPLLIPLLSIRCYEWDSLRTRKRSNSHARASRRIGSLGRILIPFPIYFSVSLCLRGIWHAGPRSASRSQTPKNPIETNIIFVTLLSLTTTKIQTAKIILAVENCNCFEAVCFYQDDLFGVTC